jgi:UDP-N-acetylmuramoyl-L-alanyl-D-glutamate--2,6-diaminopimelate ligase
MDHSVSLIDIWNVIPLESKSAIPEVTIRGVALDSRRVRPGYAFVAIVGGQTDGHEYISDAISRGASVVIGTRPIEELTVPYVQVEDARQALACVAAAYHGFPARKLRVVGVTGTDGKTTTSNLIYQILLAAGKSAGLITTVSAVVGDRVMDTGLHVTTPEAPDIQYYLAQMVRAGITHVVLEATSHGLDQGRVMACDFDLGVLTNITHEHLDYHGSYQKYREAKSRLFTSLADTPPKPWGVLRLAILNRDDTSYEYIASMLQPAVREGKTRIVSYGMHPSADVRAQHVQSGNTGLTFEVKIQGKAVRVESPLIGEYNLWNCLAAIAATAIGFGVSPIALQEGVRAVAQIPGRMERIDLGQDFLAIVDFAHTPNALKRALQTARQLTSGRVIAVFGSAGLRDKAKRRMMAEVSAQMADLTILTAEDPRTESLEGILSEMAAGAEAQGGVEGKTFWRVPDRGEAIRFALHQARTGDLVMACGKGHEQSMCFGETEYPWDDRTAMRAALAEMLGVPGPKMPYLPTWDKDG